MVKPETKLASFDDLLDLPENLVGEILYGTLVTQPRPGPKHARAASILGSHVLENFDLSAGSGSWWIIDEPELHLGPDIVVPDMVVPDIVVPDIVVPDIVVPDIAGWKQSKMPELPDTAWFDIAPDWVCEVVSPSTVSYDRSVKRDIYARELVGHYWIVDPVAKLIEVFALVDNKWVLLTTVRDDVQASLPPFESVPFDVGRLWV